MKYNFSNDDDPAPAQPAETRPVHYYGDYVRRLFLLGGAIVIFTYPFFGRLINLPIWFVVSGLLLIGIFAGLQTPRYAWSALVNTIASVVVFSYFTYKGASFYLSGGYQDHPMFFWTNELLALNFFFAIYFSIKTTRTKAKT